MEHSTSSSIIDVLSPSSSTSLDCSSSSSSSNQAINTDIYLVSDNIVNYTTETVTLCLKYKKQQYKIIEKKSTAPCCCYQTYSYSSSTTTLSNHKCPMLLNKNQSTLETLPVSSSTSCISPFLSNKVAAANAKDNKASEKQKSLFVTSLSDWVCSSMRPISIVEDSGLKNIMDQCIQIGYTCGPISASSLLPCRKTLTKEIKKNANIGRNEIKTVLIAAAHQRRLSLSPDLWSDGYKKMSYLGCTAQWVDEDWNLCTFELFCLPYRKPNKNSANIIQVIEEGLALYDLQHFMYDVIWVCDRGSNLKKALEKFTVVHCVAHRLNNVLQHTFYQAEINKVKKDVAFGDYYTNSVEDEDDQISESEEIEESCDDEQLIDIRTEVVSYVSKASSRNNPSTVLAQLAADAKRVLVTIIQCKELVKYIKKVNSILRPFY
ncbi:unnamed protein product [Rotaria sp. Silwood1]|nr:unnamed protein product [Rotaria sp. Silwood1]CAF4968995.1 unnamed protein product [Rotaria sp. Silwood1]